jgi:formylglycine-generating enzyme required for sulfatase activity
MAREYARWIGGDLPTEAQWEFAARSRGKPRLFVWGNDVERLKSASSAANVGGGREGPFQVDFENQDETEQGIYHLAGNVREWCRDAWWVYSSDPRKDFVKEPESGEKDPDYVIRGGSYMTLSETARTTWRSGEGTRGSAYTMKDDQSEEDLGVRVVLEILECQPDLGAQPRATASREARP